MALFVCWLTFFRPKTTGEKRVNATAYALGIEKRLNVRAFAYAILCLRMLVEVESENMLFILPFSLYR